MRKEPAVPGDPDRAFAELARRARSTLASSFAPSPPYLIPSFRLWHYPAAGALTTWVIFQCQVDTPRGVQPLLRRVRWDRDSDQARLVEERRRRPRLDPAVEIAEAGMEKAPLARFVTEASALSLPQSGLARPYVCERLPEYGLEGFDVEGRDGRPIVRIEWQEVAPDLRSIAEWSDRVRAWFRSVLP